MNTHDARAPSFSVSLLAVVHDVTARLRTRARSVVLLEHANYYSLNDNDGYCLEYLVLLLVHLPATLR